MVKAGLHDAQIVDECGKSNWCRRPFLRTEEAGRGILKNLVKKQLCRMLHGISQGTDPL